MKKYLEILGSSGKTVSDSSEDEILDLVRKIFPENLLTSKNVSIPALIDDAAVINQKLIGEGNEIVVTSDALVEGVDFLFDWMPSYDLGYKSLMVNLSDLAAMGAEPVGMVTVVGVDDKFPMSSLASFIEGLRESAEKHNVLLLGGDLSASEKFFVNITLIGKVPQGKSLKRSEVIEGDILAVTGNPGEAKAGFEIISGKAGNVRSEERVLIKSFLRPEARLDVGFILCANNTAIVSRETFLVRGCIDLSDGLAKDAGRIAKLNNLKAIIHADLLPASDILINFWKRRNRDYVEMIYIGGEDYELLFSVAPDYFEKTKKEIESKTGISVTKIGEWVKGQGVSLVMNDSSVRDISKLGFDHFEKIRE